MYSLWLLDETGFLHETFPVDTFGILILNSKKKFQATHYNPVDFFFILVRDWLCLVPPTAAMAGLGYMSYLAFCPEGRPRPNGRCNLAHRLNEAKVVDSVDIEDIADKAAFCRCWKSKNVSGMS